MQFIVQKIRYTLPESEGSNLLAQRAVAAFPVASTDLQHHHNKHGNVEEEHQAEITDAGGVED